MARRTNSLKRLATLVVALGVAAFFWHAFSRNWASIRAHSFEIEPVFVVLSLLAFLATSLLVTLAWHETLNALSPSKLGFPESFATVNASSLLKYIPGKLWSYALQMYWLSQRGVAKSLVVYVNLINTAVTLLMATLLSGVLLLLSPGRVPLIATLTLLGVVALLDLACVFLNARLFGWLSSLSNRFFHSRIERYDVPGAVMLRIHLLHFASCMAFAAAVYAVAVGIGYGLTLRESALVMATFLLSDVVAFVAFVSPGGLGVREGVMYALLGGATSGSLAVLIPVAARAVSMLAEVVLGVLALKLLRMPNKHRPEPVP